MDTILDPKNWQTDLWQLCKSYPKSNLRFDYPLSKQTYFGVGGNASAYLEIDQVNFLIKFARFKKKYGMNTFILGRGSNLLVSDKGFDGVVIRLGGEFKKLIVSGTSIRVGTGVSQAKLAKSAARNGLSGVEFALGIPGSVGGGLIMNAGAWNCDFSQVVHLVQVVTDNGEIVNLTAEHAQFEYRKSSLNNFFCAIYANLKLTQSEMSRVTKEMKRLYQKKIQTQPFVEGSAGCMFKNPAEHSAGWLIDQCGLKGVRVGDAEVSDVHANFIINHGKATAKDVLELVEIIQSSVKVQSGIDLQLEVKLIGF